jgi:ammonia channel protein AmtB
MMKGTLGNVAWERFPIPLVLFAMFQLKFAIITPALITGAFAERIRFNSFMLFIILFSIFIYMPLAHATWHPEVYWQNLVFLILPVVQLCTCRQVGQHWQQRFI